MTGKPIQYLIIILILVFSDCRQTKLFKNIEVVGRLLNYYSKEPIANTSVHLLADDVHSSKDTRRASIELGSATTDKDGLFVIKCNQSKQTNYYIKIDDNDPYKHQAYDTAFSTTNSKIDLGYFYCGNHDVNFKIHLAPTSGFCSKIVYPNPINISSSTDTNIAFKIDWYYSVVKDNDRSLKYWVSSTNCANQTTLSTTIYTIPIISTDTIRYQVNF